MSIKYALGRLEFKEPPEVLIPSELGKNRIETLTIQNEHAFLAGRLPLHHKDPFDRMLIAQSRIESMGIVSEDPLHFGAREPAPLPFCGGGPCGCQVGSFLRGKWW